MTLLPAAHDADTSTHVDAEVETAVPLSPEAARHLTDAIRLTVDALHVLVHRAYVGRAHAALGYARWADYVAAEFDGMSRARSYQLLTQHRVVSVLSEAAGEDVSSLVNEKVARDIKPRLELVTAEVADRTADLADRDQVLTVVAEVLNTARRPDADRLNRMPSMAQLRASQARGGASDLWYTPRVAVAPLLSILPPPPFKVWAHADVRGRSHIVDVLEEAGGPSVPEPDR